MLSLSMYNLLEVLAAGEADEKALELCRALNHAKRHRHWRAHYAHQTLVYAFAAITQPTHAR